MEGGAYKLLNTLRFWRCNARDEGAVALANLLRLGGVSSIFLFFHLLFLLLKRVFPAG